MKGGCGAFRWSAHPQHPRVGVPTNVIRSGVPREPWTAVTWETERRLHMYKVNRTIWFFCVLKGVKLRWAIQPPKMEGGTTTGQGIAARMRATQEP